ncbi:MAG: ABC transporter permease, partial [candidate division WOR-3 bacterium]
MRNIGALVGKELKELLTLRLLAPFLAIMILFLFIGRAIRGESQRAQRPQRVIVACYDTSQLAQTILDSLKARNLMVEQIRESRDAVLARARAERVPLVLVIPEGLGERIGRLQGDTIEAYTIMRSFSMVATMRGLKLKTVLEKVNSALCAAHIRKALPGIEPADVKEPLHLREFVSLREKMAEGSPELVQGMMLSQTFIIPIVLLVIIIYASQMIAASIGQEKENKTLETLLTVPINRVSIVIGKMLGAAIAAIVLAAVFMVAMTYYGSAFSQMPTEVKTPNTSVLFKLGLVMRLDTVILTGLALLLAILAALALATLLAVFSEDAKSAQAAITPLMVLCMIPYFFTLLFDIETVSLPLKLLIYAIPFSYPFITPKAVIFGNYGLVVWGL